MKKIGELMKELGFTPDSNTETQKAFVKNLVKNLPENRVHELYPTISSFKASNFKSSSKMKTKLKEVSAPKQILEPQQLSFDFENISLKKPS